MNGTSIHDDAPRYGTQSIERAATVLRTLAARGRFGWGLWDLAERCGLSRPTTHRILACLVRERLVVQRSSDKHYAPGPLIFELSLAMPAYAEFQSRCRAPLARLAKHFEAQAILYLRSGSDWVCAGYAGEPVYVGAALEIGMRRPLAFAAGGAAILIAMPPDEARLIIAENLAQADRMGDAAAKRLERMIRRSEGLGYAFNQGETTKGVHSFGVALLDTNDPDRRVFGSIAVSGHAKDFPPARAPDVIAGMREEAALVERQAAQLFRR